MIPNGYLGNLNAIQLTALQQLWACLLTVFDHGGERPQSFDEPWSPMSFQSNGSAEPSSPGLKKLQRRRSQISTNSRRSSIQQSNFKFRNLGLSSFEIKQLHRILTVATPDDLRYGMLSSLKTDHPDALLLRFLRAKKWDVGKALIMFLESIVWRTKEMHVDDEILPRGELYALKQTLSSNPEEQQLGLQFLRPFCKGKNIIHGVDRAGRPIATIRARLHFSHEQSDEMTYQYILHTIETVRMLLKYPLETTTLIFDLTGFTLANMDFAAVKFIIKCLQDIYPGGIGLIIIHNAPKIFATLWKIIKSWMSSELVSKTHFTKDVRDLERFISRDQILKEFSGNDDWEYKYIEPSLDETHKLVDFDARNAVLADRLHIAEQFLETTMTWVWTSSLRDFIGAAAANCRRDELIDELLLNYWRLDPYIRAPTLLDRTRVISGDVTDTIHFSPPTRPENAPPKPNAEPEIDFDVYFDDDDDSDDDSVEVFEAVKMPSLQMVDRSHVRLVTV